MSKYISSDKWFIRLHEEDGYAETIKELGSHISIKQCLVVRHEADEDHPHKHFHFVILLNKSILKDTLQKKFQTLFPSERKGNARYCWKVWDGNVKACSYVYHEGRDKEADIILNSGFTEAELEEFRKLDAAVAEQFKETLGNSAVGRTTTWLKKEQAPRLDLFGKKIPGRHVSDQEIGEYYVNQHMFGGKVPKKAPTKFSGLNMIASIRIWSRSDQKEAISELVFTWFQRN